jgi:ABC-type phosphate transport system substrate-binding protein
MIARKAAHYLRRIFLLLLLISGSFTVNALQAETSIEAIVHPGVNTQHLSRNSLRAIFGMRQKTWPDGLPIRVYVMPDDALLHNLFAKEKLNIFPYQLRSGWDRLIFSGTGQAPFLVNSEDEMLARVASTPGAIGYLKRVNINDSVRILHVK